MTRQKSNHLAHYAEITTIHGIKDLVFSRSRILRLAWSLCLMVTMGLLCWYTHDTVKQYLSSQTTMIASTIRLETYPPIHVCSQDWYNSTQARSYNFTWNEASFIRFSFLGGDDDADKYWKTHIKEYQDTKESVKAKMLQHNLSSVQDMISIISWNVSMESQGVTSRTQKRWLQASVDASSYVCQSISQVNQNEDFGIKFRRPSTGAADGSTYIVVGEDLFGEKIVINNQDCFLNIEIQEIKKRSLLNRPGFECTTHYDSAQACLLDCRHKHEVCNCNGTAATASYDNSESFWLLDVFKACEVISSCSQSYDYCTAQCKPCVTWNYHFILNEECQRNAFDILFTSFYDTNFYDTNFYDTNFYDANFSDANFSDANFSDANFSDANFSDANFSDAYLKYIFENADTLYMHDVNLRFTKVPIMEVTEQAYSYTTSSMLSYIGGLLGLCCGASVLSFVQLFLFWWGDECHIGKNKVEETVMEGIAKQDNIQSWVQQVTLHILHCKLCSTVTATNLQFQKNEETQASQQKINHLANYAHNTTIHGIQDFLLMKNKFLKLVWGLFLLAVASFMCEEIYRTVTNYIGTPTARSTIIVDLDTYPTIHVCSDTWYNDAQARSYGFTKEDLAFIRLAFQAPARLGDGDMRMKMKSIDRNNTAFEEQKKSVQRKMEQHNLKTVRDMLNLITWNLSIQGHEFVTSKRWRGLENDNSPFVCHTVFNASAQHDLSITLPEHADPDEFIVVGEDPFAQSIKYGYQGLILWTPRHLTLKIWDINKRSLLAKDGRCNKDYNPFGVCLQDCAFKKDLCSCNGTMKNVSYENNEDFFLLASRHDCRDDAGCNQSYDRCVEMCEPCTTWDYQVTTKPFDIDVPLNITMVPRMKVSQEYYTFPVRSLLSNIGGLMGMFCGASVLSLVQLLLFWWDDGCLPSKAKGTKMNNTEDHIKAWLQQAVLRIPQCKLCKKLTSTRTQTKQGGEVNTSQQKTNHVANYAENTSIHGIKDLVFCKNKLIKLAWGLMLLVVFCLMCEEIYSTIRDYASSPTDIDESIILMDKYPPVHACTNFSEVYDDTQAKSYGFDEDEIAIIWSLFQGSPVKGSDTQRASMKRKMEHHNLSTVQDMLNIVTKNASIADDPAPQKRWRREDDGVDYVCYTFSNVKLRDLGLIIEDTFFLLVNERFVVIGEDPFGLRYDYSNNWLSSIEVLIRESNKLSLINKGGTCSHDYNSSGVCLQDCVSKEAACNSNSTARLPSYENNEPFWLLDGRPDYVNTTCEHIHEECTEKCKLIPCITWTYESSALLVPVMADEIFFFKLNIMPNMIVSQEYYTYPASSLLANIGGLVSLFCGGSLLSIVQVILFWWDDGCCRGKGKGRKEETTGVPEDDIHKWIQHAALHRT